MMDERKCNPRTPEEGPYPLPEGTRQKMIAEDEYKYVNDPKAYEFWKSDIKATARGLKIGSSKHKEEYYRRYRQNIDPDYKPKRQNVEAEVPEPHPQGDGHQEVNSGEDLRQRVSGMANRTQAGCSTTPMGGRARLCPRCRGRFIDGTGETRPFVGS